MGLVRDGCPDEVTSVLQTKAVGKTIERPHEVGVEKPSSCAGCCESL